jgi:hypothetical protein
VIDRIARFNRDLDSGFTHTTQENRPAIISNLHSHFQPVPVTAFFEPATKSGTKNPI